MTERIPVRLLAVLLAALGLRFWIASQPGIGHDGDIALFVRWIRGLSDHGLAGFYAVERFCDYPPLMLLLFRSLGAGISFLLGDPSDHALRLGVKALACLGDVAIGLLILSEGRKLLGAGGATLAAGIYLLNPVSLYDSAYWGQLDSIHTGLLLFSLVLLRRRRWAGAGASGALALTAKFQSVAILPLLFLEAYRVARGRGVSRVLGGGTVCMAAIAVPFVLAGNLAEVVDRAYIGVVGQYHAMSNNAYNLWYLVADPNMSDTAPPDGIVRAVAGNRDVVPVGDSWLMLLTWRNISLALFALSVAIVLSLYARRPGGLRLYGAAGLLALCFFLFPTEMHERYAYPAVAFLAVWAAAARLHERIFWVLTIALTLNLAAVVPPAPLAPQISLVNLAIFGAIAGVFVLPRPKDDDAAPILESPCPGNSRAIRLFQTGTVAAVAMAATIAIATALWVRSVDPDPVDVEDGIWLTDLSPRVAKQGWKTPAMDRSVEGGLLRIGSEVYLRGIGTHAPATLVYEIPPGCDVFEAVVGIDEIAREEGSVALRIEVDGAAKTVVPLLTAASGAFPVRIDVTGGTLLTIRIDPTEDGRRSDHVDLALARFRKRPGDLDPRLAKND